MAVAFRPFRSFSSLLALVLAAHLVFAAPALTDSQLTRINDPNVILDNSSNGTLVYSPVTGQQIPQGLASDGSGSGFSMSAVLWIVFSFVVGAPLLLVGFRAWRFTLGAAVGTAAALATWSVIVNTLDNVGVSDITLTACILVLFFMGFGLGLLEMTRVIAILVLGALGGLAIGVRIVILRTGLLVSDTDAFFVNWFVIGVCGIAGSILVVWKQRYGILNGCASTGSFFCALGFDLVVNQQAGMSRGLRFLFDRNSYHILATLTNGYSPPWTTVVILAVSLGLTPAFAFAQWKFYKLPFGGDRYNSYSGSPWDAQEIPQHEESAIPQRSVDLPDTPATEKPPKLSLSADTKQGQSS